MPNTKNSLPIQCPKCHHVGCRLLAESFTVMTLRCAGCHHAWATDLSFLSPEIQEKVHATLRDM